MGNNLIPLQPWEAAGLLLMALMAIVAFAGMVSIIFTLLRRAS